MTSDNVIRPSFGAKNKTVTPEPSATPQADAEADDYAHVGPLEGESLEKAMRDLLYLRTHMDHVQNMRDKILAAGDHVFDLKDYRGHKKSIDLRRQGLKKNSLEELCAMIENSSTLQWNTEPSFIGALTLEYQCRIDAALSLLAPDGSMK